MTTTTTTRNGARMTGRHPVHVRLDQAHRRIDVACTTLATAAVDRHRADPTRIVAAYRRIDAACTRLAAMALEDLHGMAMPASPLTAPVSGGTSTSTTEAAAGHVAIDYDRICGRLEDAATRLEHLDPDQADYGDVCEQFETVADRLEDFLDQLTPRATDVLCRTHDCKAEGTHRGRCWRCDRYVRRHRTEPPPRLVKDWNRRLYAECGCGTDCCPDGCLDMVEPGQGSVSTRCRQRRSRANRRAQTTTAGHPWQWHNPEGAT